MDATVAWAEGEGQRASWLGGCWEVRGRVVRPGLVPRVVEDDHLVLVAGGAGARMRQGRRVAPLPPGELVEVEAGDVVSVELPQDCTFSALRVQPALLAEVAGSLDGMCPFVHGPGGQTRLACCLGGDAALGRVREALASEEALRSFLRYALGTCAGGVRPSDQTSSHAVVMRIRGYLREAFARAVTLDQLGRMAGMCRFALVRAFTREVGLPPHAYQTHLRVLRACALIRAGTPLSAAALDVGFSDQSHLCRHFKRIAGITPGTYAREVAGAGWATLSKPPLPDAA